MNCPNDRSVIAHSIHNKDYHTNGLKHCKDLTDRQLKHQGRKHRELYLCLSGRTMFSYIVWPINKISHCKTYNKAAKHRKSYRTTDLNQLSFLFLFLFLQSRSYKKFIFYIFGGHKCTFLCQGPPDLFPLWQIHVIYKTSYGRLQLVN